MGTGASALKSELAQATPEQLQEAVAALSEDDRKRVREAMEIVSTNFATSDAKDDANGPETKTLKLEWSEHWQETGEDLFDKFIEENAINPTTWDYKCLGKNGNELESHEDTTKEDFPLSFVFTKPEGDEGGFDLAALKNFLKSNVADMTKAMTEGKSEEAPYLRELYQKIYKISSDKLENMDMDKMMEMAFDPELMAAEKAKQAAFIETECKPLLEKSFQKHDKNGNGTLSPEEAAAFFKNVTFEATEFVKAIAGMSLMFGLKQSIDMMVQMVPPEQMKEMAEEIKSQMSTQIDMMKKMIEKMKEDYLANKAELDAAAFKVVDTNGDGTLQKQEFIAAFEQDSEKNLAFMKALGLSLTPPAVGNGECPMQ